MGSLLGPQQQQQAPQQQGFDPNMLVPLLALLGQAAGGQRQPQQVPQQPMMGNPMPQNVPFTPPYFGGQGTGGSGAGGSSAGAGGPVIGTGGIPSNQVPMPFTEAGVNPNQDDWGSSQPYTEWVSPFGIRQLPAIWPQEHPYPREELESQYYEDRARNTGGDPMEQTRAEESLRKKREDYEEVSGKEASPSKVKAELQKRQKGRGGGGTGESGAGSSSGSGGGGSAGPHTEDYRNPYYGQRPAPPPSPVQSGQVSPRPQQPLFPPGPMYAPQAPWAPPEVQQQQNQNQALRNAGNIGQPVADPVWGPDRPGQIGREMTPAPGLSVDPKFYPQGYTDQWDLTPREQAAVQRASEKNVPYAQAESDLKMAGGDGAWAATDDENQAAYLQEQIQARMARAQVAGRTYEEQNQFEYDEALRRQPSKSAKSESAKEKPPTPYKLRDPFKALKKDKSDEERRENLKRSKLERSPSPLEDYPKAGRYEGEGGYPRAKKRIKK